MLADREIVLRPCGSTGKIESRPNREVNRKAGGRALENRAKQILAASRRSR
jgi:hypothetical protein